MIILSKIIKRETCFLIHSLRKKKKSSFCHRTYNPNGVARSSADGGVSNGDAVDSNAARTCTTCCGRCRENFNGTQIYQSPITFARGRKAIEFFPSLQPPTAALVMVPDLIRCRASSWFKSRTASEASASRHWIYFASPLRLNLFFSSLSFSKPAEIPNISLYSSSPPAS